MISKDELIHQLERLLALTEPWQPIDPPTNMPQLRSESEILERLESGQCVGLHRQYIEAAVAYLKEKE